MGAQQKTKSEKRSQQDRRIRKLNWEFPFIDSHGELVTIERRSFVERRVNKQ